MKKAEREKLFLERLTKMKNFDEGFYKGGPWAIGGVDEAGRGPLAGPVVAACVVLPRDFDVPGIYDSKKLTEKKRNEMAGVIGDRALAYGVAMVDNKVIDRINILEATKGAMGEAVKKAAKMFEEKTGASISHLIIDAVPLKNLTVSQTAMVGGDEKSLCVAAASILAKVTRDDIMVKYSRVYPGYAFERNKGYGTKAHYGGIEKQGICPIHRRTFLKGTK